jgi:hypothetical protein
MSIGIDYGLGQTNIDRATGIRYGVISHHSVSLDSWNEVSEVQYGEPTCPKCGNEAITIPSHTEASDPPGAWVHVIQDIPEAYEEYEASRYEAKDFACEDCEYLFGSESAFGDEPLGFTFKDADYFAHCGTDGFGIWIERSPFYTYAGFCSPCAPGAGDLDNALSPTLTSDRDRYDSNVGDHGVKTYCFGHDWFDGGVAPYRVFRVSDNSEVLPEDK